MMRVNWNHFIPMVTSTNKMASVSRTISEVSGSLTSDTSNPIPPESLLEMEDEEIKQILRQTELVCSINCIYLLYIIIVKGSLIHCLVKKLQCLRNSLKD